MSATTGSLSTVMSATAVSLSTVLSVSAVCQPTMMSAPEVHSSRPGICCVLCTTCAAAAGSCLCPASSYLVTVWGQEKLANEYITFLYYVVCCVGQLQKKSSAHIRDVCTLP